MINFHDKTRRRLMMMSSLEVSKLKIVGDENENMHVYLIVFCSILKISMFYKYLTIFIYILFFVDEIKINTKIRKLFCNIIS